MKINLNIVFLILLSSLYCQSQNSRQDSLLNVVKISKNDTAKVNALNELFLEFEFSDEKKAKGYLDEAIEYCNAINYKNGLANTYIYSGYFYEDKSDFSTAISYYQKALALFTELLNREGSLKAYNNIGNAYLIQSKYKEALANYNACLKIGLEIKYVKGIINAYNNIGLVWLNQGEYSLALPNFKSALKFAIGNKPETIKCHNYIGSVFSYQGNYNEALRHYLLGLNVAESSDEKVEMASSYNNLGTLYTTMGNYADALKNHKLSLEIRKKLDNKRSVAYSYNNIGNVYFEMGDYMQALVHDYEALKIAKDFQDVFTLSSVYNNIGMVFYKQALGERNSEIRLEKLNSSLDNHFLSLKLKEERADKSGIASSYNNLGMVYFQKKEFILARKYTMMGRDLSQKIGYKEYLKEAYFELSRLDSAQNNYKGAYENHKMYILYRDSLDNEETRKKTIQSQMTYEFEKKEAVATAEHKKELENQNVLAEEKSRKQKVVLSLVSCFLLLVLVFAGFIFKSLRTTRKQKALIEYQKHIVEEQKKEVELQKVIVEEHQKEIIDSIRYARRIQQSLLPTEKYISSCFKRLMK